MSSMTNRDLNILEAAVRMFSRYGVKRTSMGDLAAEAGVSRQTLYKAYKNKNDVLQALIRYYTDKAVDEIEAGLADVTDLGDQLDVVFDKMSLAGFDLVQATPNAKDIIEGFNEVGQKEIEASAERYRAVIERIFAPHRVTLERSGLTVPDVSDLVEQSAKAAIVTAHDRGHLVRRLKMLKKLCQIAAASEIIR